MRLLREKLYTSGKRLFSIIIIWSDSNKKKARRASEQSKNLCTRQEHRFYFVIVHCLGY